MVTTAEAAMATTSIGEVRSGVSATFCQTKHTPLVTPTCNARNTITYMIASFIIIVSFA